MKFLHRSLCEPARVPQSLAVHALLASRFFHFGGSDFPDCRHLQLVFSVNTVTMMFKKDIYACVHLVKLLFNTIKFPVNGLQLFLEFGKTYSAIGGTRRHGVADSGDWYSFGPSACCSHNNRKKRLFLFSDPARTATACSPSLSRAVPFAPRPAAPFLPRSLFL